MKIIDKLKIKEKDIKKVAKDKITIFYLWYYIVVYSLMMFIIPIYQGIQNKLYGYTDFEFALSSLIVAFFYGTFILWSIYSIFRFIKKDYPPLLKLLVIAEALPIIFVFVFYYIYDFYNILKLLFVIYLLMKINRLKKKINLKGDYSEIQK